MSLLSERQESDLHRAIREYLKARSMTKSLDAFEEESGIGAAIPSQGEEPKYTGLLEKKWTSVVRLQKKIFDLEKQVGELQQELAAAPSQRASSSVKDWTPRNPRHILSGHRDQVTALAFHPIISVLATSSDDATIKIWDWETGDFERTLKGHTRLVSDLDFDSKGRLLASCSSDLSIRLWDTNNEYANLRTLHGHDHSVSSVRFIPGDDYLVSASRDNTLRFWEVATGFCTRTLNGHTAWVRFVRPSEDGRYLVSGGDDHTARVWDAKSGESKAELRAHDHFILVGVFAPVSAYDAIKELTGTGRPKEPYSFVVTGSRDKTIKLWDAASGQVLREFVGHGDWIRALVFHPNGKYLLSASDDKTIRTWDIATGRCIKTLNAHDHFITCCMWGRQVLRSAGGTNGEVKEEERRVNVLATGCADHTVRIWMP